MNLKALVDDGALWQRVAGIGCIVIAVLDLWQFHTFGSVGDTALLTAGLTTLGVTLPTIPPAKA